VGFVEGEMVGGPRVGFTVLDLSLEAKEGISDDGLLVAEGVQVVGGEEVGFIVGEEEVGFVVGVTLVGLLVVGFTVGMKEFGFGFVVGWKVGIVEVVFEGEVEAIMVGAGEGAMEGGLDGTDVGFRVLD